MKNKKQQRVVVARFHDSSIRFSVNKARDYIFIIFLMVAREIRGRFHLNITSEPISDKFQFTAC